MRENDPFAIADVLLYALTTVDLPLPLPITLDLVAVPVLVFSLAISVIAGLFLGLIPAERPGVQSAGITHNMLLRKTGRETMQIGVDALDALTFAAAPTILITVAAVSAYVAAHRASRINPVSALRAE